MSNSEGSSRLDRVDPDHLDLGPAAPSPEDASSSADNERDKITVEISADTARRARAAVYYTPGLTLYELVDKGLEVMVDYLEEERGESFPDGKTELTGGRPPKF